MTAAFVVFFWSSDPLSSYLLVIVVGFGMIFFGLTLGLARWAARDKRWSPPGHQPTFDEFVDDNADTATGIIAGREAALQILTLPVVLALGATAIGVVFWIVG